MPIYEYKCSNCDLKFDKYLSVEYYNKPADCPDCGSTKDVIKQISFVRVHSRNPDIKRDEQWAKDNDAIIREPGIKKDVMRNKEYKEKKYQDNIKKAIVDTIEGA